ncbi:unnamed protein product [Adineta steineri]|uniref:Uncharacterized protein n=1 Tax=Adineta steineri TaxID=433720 RepID=A0A814GIR0_9BILA|nr:unnamed protein product [Adineta steineri]
MCKIIEPSNEIPVDQTEIATTNNIPSNEDQLLLILNREELIAYFNQKVKIEQLHVDLAIGQRDFYKIFQHRLEPLVDLFHSLSTIHIFESDSKDKSLEKLRQWSRAQALRNLSDTILNYDVRHRVRNLDISWKNCCPESIFDQIIGIYKIQMPIEHGLIEVRSAFNDAESMYKANDTYKCQYNGAKMTGEYVPFHLCIRKLYPRKIFINPQFQVS